MAIDRSMRIVACLGSLALAALASAQDSTETGKQDFSRGSEQHLSDPHPRHKPPPESWLMTLMHDVRKQVFSSRLDFMSLLKSDEIRREIGLGDADFEALVKSNQMMFEEIKALHAGSRKPNRSHDRTEDSADARAEHQQLVARIAQLIREHDQRFLEELRNKTNFDRFIEILVQARGNRAAIHDEVASKIGLSADDLEEIRSVNHQVWREQWDELGDRMREWIRKGEDLNSVGSDLKAEIRNLVERAECRVNEAVGRRLTREQFEALKQLRGEPFAFSEDFFEIRLPPLPGPRGFRGRGPR